LKKLTAIILALSLIISSNYCIFAEDSFVVSLQTARTLIYDANSYYEMADVVKTEEDFYLFFCIDKTLDLSAYQLKLYYDKNFVELVKDNGTGSLIPMVDTIFDEYGTIISVGDAPVKFDSLFSQPHLQAFNICSTSEDGRGQIDYLVSLKGDTTVFPAKTEPPYYRLASIHFRVKQTAPEGQALFSLETDRYKAGVTLFNKEGRKFAYSADATKIINIHTVMPAVPLPPVASYDYNYAEKKWYLSLAKEDDPTVEILYKTTFNGTFVNYTIPIALDEYTIIYSHTQRTRGDYTADSTTITFATPTVAANPPPGGYDTAPANISLYSVPSGYDVYYTTDVSIIEPADIATLTKYISGSPIPFPANSSDLAIKTILGKDGVLFGDSFKTLNYTIRPNAPVASPNGGTHTSSVAVTLNSTTADCAIYYTLDGITDPVPPVSIDTAPTPPTIKYDGVSPINIKTTSKLKAIAVKDSRISSVASFEYTIVPPSSGGGGGGGGTKTVYKYVTIESILSELKYKVIDGKAVYEIPRIEGETSGDYEIITDAPQDEIEIKFTLQDIINGARGLKKISIKTKTDTFTLPFYNIDYPLAVEASKGIKPIDVPVTLTYSRKEDESSLLDNAELVKGSKFYSYKLTSYIDTVPFPMKYLIGYAQYIIPANEMQNGKTPIGIAMNGNIIQTPLFVGKTADAKESVVLRTLSDHPVCITYGDKRTYNDITDGWFQNDIERLSTIRIVNGRPGGFEPNIFITRAELSAMITRALGAVMKDTTATAFKDLDKTHWSYYEANNAQKWSLINGYPDFTFRAEKPITRLETIQMLANALSYTNRDAFVNTVESGKYLSGITDAEQIESWAVPSVTMIIKYGIIKGYEDGTIRPNNNVTRAEAATLIARLLKNFELIN